MSKEVLLFAGTAAAAPLALAASPLPLPQGLPIWMPWVLALAGPALVFLSKAALKALASFLRAKAKELKSDKDPKNDAAAPVLESVADSLDSVAQKKEE